MGPINRRTLLGSTLGLAAAGVARSAEVSDKINIGKTPHTRFAANVEMWWHKLPFLDRIREAAKIGFPAIEFWPWQNKDVGAITDLTEHVDREIELAKKTAILETILENMDQGISMIDDDFRFVEFNRKFFDIQDLPQDQFSPGVSIEEVYRYLAERGEFGPGDVDKV